MFMPISPVNLAFYFQKKYFADQMACMVKI